MPVNRYADFVAGLRAGALPDEVLHHARRNLIDWYATTAPGSVTAPATLLREALAEELGHGGARLLPDGAAAPARAAALINGAASHTVEFDDIYRSGLYHPGSPTISAALAVAEAAGKDGETLLQAIVAGYEVSNRIAAAMVPAHYAFWHTTGTVGCFGAAAAACRVLELDARRCAHALNGVATMAAGLQQAFRSDAMSKPMHAGRAAEAGVLCALGARAGMTGASGMLDGERGFGMAMSAEVDWASAVAGLGEHWTITETTQKNHGCCGHTFAAVDGVIALREAHGLDADNVVGLEVATYAAGLEICGDTDPTTGYEGKFSLPYCVAVALVDGRVRLDAFDAEHLNSPEIRGVMQRVSLSQDAEAQAAFPHRRSARVRITTRDGRRLEHFARTRKGDPDAPLSDAELVDKYRELVAPVLGEGGGEMLLDALWRVDVLDDVGALPLPDADAALRLAGE
jgi:2-methylcitrate dehydratase PrpD